MAENLLRKQQPLVLNRPRRRAPRLSGFDRILFGVLSLFPTSRRRVRAAIILKPSTLLCRLFSRAISRQGTPKYLSSDNDPLFRYPQWQANLPILDVEQIKAVPYNIINGDAAAMVFYGLPVAA